MKLEKGSLKIFLCSVLSTVLFITLLCCLIITEKNIRLVAFGDNSPFFVFKHEGYRPTYIKFHFMGKDYCSFL